MADQTLRRELRHRRAPGRTDRDQPFHQQPTVGMINAECASAQAAASTSLRHPAIL